MYFVKSFKIGQGKKEDIHSIGKTRQSTSKEIHKIISGGDKYCHTKQKSRRLACDRLF